MVLGSPDVEVSEERVEKLGKLWLIMILRLRDPKLEAFRRGSKEELKNQLLQLITCVLNLGSSLVNCSGRECNHVWG